MGASIDQIKAYTLSYIPKLQVKGGPKHLQDDSLVESYNSVDDLLGKNSRYNFNVQADFICNFWFPDLSSLSNMLLFDITFTYDVSKK